MSLKTGYTVDQAPIWSYANGRSYVVNDFDQMLVWDGFAAGLNSAGITGPAVAPTAPATGAGTTTVGTHLVRYRYLDSTSPASLYRSNTSANYTLVTASAATAAATFSVGAAGTNLITSADPKVDTIQLEATLASGSLFYVVGSQLQTLTSFVFNLADALLQVNALAGAYDDNPSVPTNADYGQGHETPPLAAIVQQCRDYLFLGGFHQRTVTVAVTNGSAAITAPSGLSTNWAGRMLRVGTDTKPYQLLTVSATTGATLTTTYTGTTNSAASAVEYSKNPCLLYWSSNKGGGQLVESWKALTRARNMLIGRGEKTIRGLMEYQGDLIVCGRRTIQRLIFVDDPALGELDTLPGNFGVWNQRCLVNFDGQVFGWGPNGWWTLRGGWPVWISQGVDLTVMGDSTNVARADLTQSDKFHGHADPLNKVLRWFYVPTGGTTPTESAVYHLLNQEWSLDQFRQGINASTVAQDANGRVRAVLSDSTNGYSWYGVGATDGVPSSSSGAYTGAAGSTVTVTNVVDALPTGTALGSNLNGVMLYRPGTGEAKAITSNTASAMTTAAFGTAVAAGEAVYAGAIPFDVLSGWYDFKQDGSLAAKQRCQLAIYFTPSTAGLLRVKVYLDFSATSMTFTNPDNNTWGRGIIMTPGNGYVDLYIDSINTDGFVAIPQFLEFARALRWEVMNLSPAGQLRIQEIKFLTNEKNARMVTTE